MHFCYHFQQTKLLIVFYYRCIFKINLCLRRKETNSYLIGYVVGKPVQTFVKALPRGCTGALDIPGRTRRVYQTTTLQTSLFDKDLLSEYLPVALSERVETQLVGDLSSIHSIRKILFVGEHKQYSISQFILKRKLKLRFLCIIDISQFT